MATSFQRRRLRITLQLAVGTFSAAGNPDTITLEDFRTRVEISAPGGYEYNSCQLRIYGVTKDVMDRLTFINYQNLDLHRNVLRVEATDNEGQFTTVFLGEIIQAYPEYAGAPDVPFFVDARSGMVASLAPAQAVSYPGAQKISVMMAQLANELGLVLENNGVEGTLTDQYLGGTPLQKVQRIAASARIQYWYLPEQGVLAIAPMGEPRKSEPVLYSVDTGLVGWPSRIHEGISFKALFTPQIFHGCRIRMESSVPACNGEWYIISMNHKLDSTTPGGAWFSEIKATPPNLFVRK